MKNHHVLNQRLGIIYFNCIKFFFLVLSFLFIQDKVFCSDIKDISLDTLKLFSSGNEIPEKQSRNYADFFDPQTQYINIELNVANLSYGKALHEHDIKFIWRFYNGSIFGSTDAKFVIQPEWQTAYINRRWGFNNVGKWPEGLFTAQVFIDGHLFAEKDFFITSQNNYRSVLSFTQKTITELQNTTLIDSYKIIQQIKIPIRINVFEDFNISKNGEAISYTLGNHSISKSYQTTTTHLDKMLFINNKQIIPTGFSIRSQFNDDFKNIFYSKYILNSSHAGNYHLNRWYGYFNGQELYNSLIDASVYFSEINNEMAYILGYNNSKLQRGLGLQILSNYDYLMRNQKKIQPELLANSKVAKIKNPIVFKLNSDSTQSVYYTAEFKEKGKTLYGLFNEDHLVSSKFDDIGKPHLSSDKMYVLCTAKDVNNYFILMDGKKASMDFSYINDEYIFCDLMGSLYYHAKINEKWYLIKGNSKISDGFDEIGYTMLDEKNDKVYYKAKRNGKWSIYFNNVRITNDFDEIGDFFCISTDGKKVAYAAAKDNFMFVMVNDNKVSPDFKIYHQIDILSNEGTLALTDLNFNQHGDKVAYKVIYDYVRRFSDSPYAKNSCSYIMINSEQISPKMYNTKLYGEPGKLTIVGIEINDLIIHHFKIDY